MSDLSERPDPLDDDRTRISTGTGVTAAPKDASLVQIHGPELGKRIPLGAAPVTLGRGTQNNIILDDADVSRVHAKVSAGATGYLFEDLGSSNGSQVNDQAVQERVLKSGDIIRIGKVIFKFIAGGSAEAAFHEEIYRLTIHDGLTDIPNRRCFNEFLERELARAARYDRPLALMLFDIDHFKRVNDTFGHLAGDHVLRKMAAVLKSRIRREELLARYGGEEFAIVMPEVSLDNASTFAEKLRVLVEGTRFAFDGNVIPVTISIGVVERQSGMDEVGILKAADEALYRAKEDGRNRVSVWPSG